MMIIKKCEAKPVANTDAYDVGISVDRNTEDKSIVSIHGGGYILYFTQREMKDIISRIGALKETLE